MDFVRDFVGGSCEGGNSLSQFVNKTDRAGSQRVINQTMLCKFN